MSVHLQLSEQVNKRLAAEKEYQRLDALREKEIEKTLNDAQHSQDFSVTSINQITESMNELTKQYSGFPLRKNVTKDMIKDYLATKQ